MPEFQDRASPTGRPPLGALLALALGLAACHPSATPAPTVQPDLGGAVRSDPLASLPAAVRAKASEEVWEALATGQPQDLVLELDVAEVTRRAFGKPSTGPASTDQVGTYAVKYAEAKHDALAPLALSYYLVLTDYEQLPLAFVRVTGVDGGAAILVDARVAGLHADARFQRQDPVSFDLIQQPAAVATGHDGSGAAIAVLDTGCDYRLPDFGSCTAPGTPASCRVDYAIDIAHDDQALDDRGHGTNVAAIAAGAAPGARIVALDVFRDDAAYTSDILTAFNWLIGNKRTYNITAINLSLGARRFAAPCDRSLFRVAIDTARVMGMLTVAAAGNDGWSDALAEPACVPGVLSVGAVYSMDFGGMDIDGCTESSTAKDKVACFSNSAPFLSLLAPGAMISGGGVSLGGTSQAAPHVAGAVAVLRGAFPAEPLETIVHRLVAGGAPVEDGRNKRVTPRLDLGKAAAGCVFVINPPAAYLGPEPATLDFALSTGADCKWTLTTNSPWLTFTGDLAGAGPAHIGVAIEPNPGGATRNAVLKVSGDADSRTVVLTQGLDDVAPVGKLVIDGGAAATRVPLLDLAITATDASGVKEMCLTTGVTCGAYVPFANATTFSVTPGDGSKTVRLFLRDGRGNTSTLQGAAGASIFLDSQPPTGGALTTTSGHAQVALAWGGFVDKGSGVGGYRLVASSVSAPASCDQGKVLYEGPDASFTHDQLLDGTLWYYLACALDKAGNVSSGAAATGLPRPESNPPTGTVVIEGGALYTGRTQVRLDLAATDDTGVDRMCISTGNTCNAWEKFALTRIFTIPAGDGLKTVNAWFADAWGNATPQPASATISLDTAAPTGGALKITGGDKQLALKWDSFQDKGGAGVATYKVVWAEGPAPGSCAQGQAAYEGAYTDFLHDGLKDGTTYGYRVCAVDGAGNVGAGVTGSQYPAPEYDPPVGSVLINGGAPLTNDVNVTVVLDATDLSGVASMCISNAPGCVMWEAYSPTRSLALLNSPGVRTVYASFRDVWGTASKAFTSTITLDNVPPTEVTVTATPGVGQIGLTWTASADPGSGVASYVLMALPGAVPPAARCESGNLLYSGAQQAFTHLGLQPADQFSYRLCVTDNAGNVNAGTTKTATAK